MPSQAFPGIGIAYTTHQKWSEWKTNGNAVIAGRFRRKQVFSFFSIFKSLGFRDPPPAAALRLVFHYDHFWCEVSKKDCPGALGQAVIFALNRTKVQMSTPFLRVKPWNFAHVFNVPLPSLFYAFFFFFAENVGSLKTQISPKNTKTQTSDEENENNIKSSVKGSAGTH